MLDPALTPAPVEGYDLESIDGELVLYHPTTESIFYCNESAALIFRLCDGRRSVAEITRLIADAYPEAQARVGEDVTTTIARLVQHGALRV